VIQEGKTFYDFSATALGVKGGSVLTAYFEKESGAFGLLTEGSTVTTNAQYVLVGIRSRPQGEDTWSTSNLKIPAEAAAGQRLTAARGRVKMRG
jgi:hypothetical protein